MAAPTTSDTADLPTKDDAKDVADTGKSSQGAGSKEAKPAKTTPAVGGVPPKKRAVAESKKKKHLKLDAAKVQKKSAKEPKLNPDGTAKVKRRAKNGSRAMAEIKFQQRNSANKSALAWAPFKRLVYEVAHEMDPKLRFKKGAVEALREEAQAHLVRLFSVTNNMVRHVGKRAVIKPDDLKTADAMINRPDLYNAGIRDPGALHLHMNYST